MATVDNLRVSLLDIPEEEGKKLVFELRALRRIMPEPKVKKKAKGKSGTAKKPKKKMTADQAVDNMSPEQKKQLLLQLTGGKP